MATYVNNLRLKEIATGDESGTWGTSTNLNLELVGQALGYGTEGITTNADAHATTIADGAADEGRALFLKYTGTLDSACTITLGPNTVKKVWIIENATSGSQNIIISQGSGANITIAAGKNAVVYTDGAGSGAAVLDAFADLELSSTLSVAGATTLTGVTTHGDDVVSDTDSTDDLGTTGVRWANVYADDVVATTTVKPGTLVLAAGSITDTSGAITFGNENLVTTGTNTSGEFVGPLTGNVTGNTSGSSGSTTGNAATATALATAREIGGTSFDGTANIAVALATLATTVTITDNESTNENNAIVFTAGGDVDGGNLGLESDGTLTYNPSTGKVTTTAVDTQTLVVDGVSTLTGAITASSSLECAGAGTFHGSNAITLNRGSGSPAIRFQEAGTSVAFLVSEGASLLRVYNAAASASGNLQVNALTADGAGTIGGNLIVTGTGPSAIGGAADGRIATLIGGAYTSDGSGNLAVGTALQHALTGAAGDTGSLAIAHVRGNVNTQSATESIGVVASLKVDEPIIVDNLGGSGVVTVAASLYVTAAPTEGATSAALYVAAGATMLKGATFVGDTANSKMTLGLTVNQGAADNEIFALKSSDVGHNMTNKAEADTYGAFRKYQATSGGLTVGGLKDADGVAGLALVLEGFLGEAADTTKSTSAVGIVQVETAVTAGDGNVQAAGSDSNLFTVANNGTARFIFDAEGSGHADVEWTTFSDSRLKTNVAASPYGLAEVRAIDAKIFDKHSGKIVDGSVVLEEGSDRRMIGFIAQDVRAQMSELVKALPNDGSFYSMDYGRMTPVLWSAMQELDAEVQTLKARIAALEA